MLGESISSIFSTAYSSTEWVGIAKVSHDTVIVNSNAVAKIISPKGLLDNPYFWNIMAVILGGLITLMCNLITQFVVEKIKSKKDKNLYAIDLAWTITRGIEFSRSIDKIGLEENKIQPYRHLLILPTIGNDYVINNFDITKIGFLSGIIAPEFPSKAREYIGYISALTNTIAKRNEIYSKEYQPKLNAWQCEHHVEEFDLRDVEKIVGQLVVVNLKTLTDAMYYQVEYLEEKGNSLVAMINAALKKMNPWRPWKRKPPYIGIIPKNHNFDGDLNE
jgi:hypothetical protein